MIEAGIVLVVFVLGIAIGLARSKKKTQSLLSNHEQQVTIRPIEEKKNDRYVIFLDPSSNVNEFIDALAIDTEATIQKYGVSLLAISSDDTADLFTCEDPTVKLDFRDWLKSEDEYFITSARIHKWVT